MPGQDERQARLAEVEGLYAQGKLFRSLDQVCKDAPPLRPLWGYFLFRQAVTAIIGDPGVCKTTMGYGLCMSLCKGEPFLEITPEEPVRTLYLDFESADSLVKSRRLLIHEGSVPHFTIYNMVDFTLPDIAQVASRFIKANGVNLVMIDNQSMAFSTRDENDNAEAIKQMRFIRSWGASCGVAVVLFHHTSKANLPGTRKGSGAFARARLADIAINIDLVDGYQDIVKLSTVKNRLVDERVEWYIKKEEGQFTLTDPPPGEMGGSPETTIYKVQRALLDTMEPEVAYKHGELAEALDPDFSPKWVEHGLSRLIQQGRLTKPSYGHYARV